MSTLMHVRLIVPEDVSGEVHDFLVGHDSVTAVVCHDEVTTRPEGQLIECDVAREGLNEVLVRLREAGVDERGTITLLEPAGTPYAGADELERRSAGDPADAVIWESVLAEARDGAVLSVSFLVFLALAVTLAAIAVLTDSAVLVVGAMVVGPEFAAVAAVCVGLAFGRFGIVGRAAALLVGSFAFAIAAVTVLALLGRVTGLVTADQLTRERPQTGFIWHPDAWSFVVAMVAGTAGVLALSLDQGNAMVGVFISVTTVPAAGNLALGLAFLDGGEITGSLAQLGLNIAGMLLAGTVFVVFQRLCWSRLAILAERVSGRAALGTERRSRLGSEPS